MCRCKITTFKSRTHLIESWKNERFETRLQVWTQLEILPVAAAVRWLVKIHQEAVFHYVFLLNLFFHHSELPTSLWQAACTSAFGQQLEYRAQARRNISGTHSEKFKHTFGLKNVDMRWHLKCTERSLVVFTKLHRPRSDMPERRIKLSNVSIL